MNKFITILLASCFAVSALADTTTKPEEIGATVVESVDKVKKTVDSVTVDPVTGEETSTTTTQEVTTPSK